MWQMEIEWLIIGIKGGKCKEGSLFINELITLIPEINLISEEEYMDTNNKTNTEKLYGDIKNLINTDRLMYRVTMCNKWIANGYENNERDLQSDLQYIKSQLNDFQINILVLHGFSMFDHPNIKDICHIIFSLVVQSQPGPRPESLSIYKKFKKQLDTSSIGSEKTTENVIFINETDVAIKCCNSVIYYLVERFQICSFKTYNRKFGSWRDERKLLDPETFSRENNNNYINNDD